MDESEENRLARLLLIVRREEREEVLRPTGAFFLQLFNDLREEDIGIAGSADDEGEEGLTQDLKGFSAIDQEEGNFITVYTLNDFDDLEKNPYSQSIT